MKRYFFILALMFTVGAAFGAIVFGSLTTLNNSTAISASNSVGSFSLPAFTLNVTNNGLSQTTDLKIIQRTSLDGTNWATNYVWNPPSTNAGTYQMACPAATLTVLQDFQAVTTNSVQFGAY